MRRSLTEMSVAGADGLGAEPTHPAEEESKKTNAIHEIRPNETEVSYRHRERAWLEVKMF